MGFEPEMDKCMANPNMPVKSMRNTLIFSATFADSQTKEAEYLKDSFSDHRSVGRSLSGCDTDLPRGREKGEEENSDVNPER